MCQTDSALARASEIVRFHVYFGTAEHVLRTHVDDGSGHCAGCAWQDVPRPVWPCDHVHYAGIARDLETRVDDCVSCPGTGVQRHGTTLEGLAGRPRS